jgi:hypothetical protein
MQESLHSQECYKEDGIKLEKIKRKLVKNWGQN